MEWRNLVIKGEERTFYVLRALSILSVTRSLRKLSPVMRTAGWTDHKFQLMTAGIVVLCVKRETYSSLEDARKFSLIDKPGELIFI